MTLKDCGFVSVRSFKEMEAALTINPAISLEQKITNGTPYMLAKNVLSNPDAFVELLKEYPAYDYSEKIWLTPGHIYGYRQRIDSIEVAPLIHMWHIMYARLSGIITPFSVRDWFTATNIYNADTKVNMLPHHDAAKTSYVGNLCLSKGIPSAGLGFYALKIGEKRFTKFSDLNEEEVKRFNEIDNECRSKPYPWKPWKPNPYWELYLTLPNDNNTSYLYDGNYFHQGIYDDEHRKQLRYSLISFRNEGKK